MNDLEFFADSEFACKCGKCGLGVESMDNRLLGILQAIRRALGEPVIISSAVRCQEHNKNCGGTANSEHVPENTDNGKCTAVDIKLPNSNYTYRLLRELYAHDVPRIGWSQKHNFVHVGLSEAACHPQHVLFKY